jgi:hypothetical protein
MVKTVVAYGGTSVGYQLNSLRNGCNILVATPGRWERKLFFYPLIRIVQKVQILCKDEEARSNADSDQYTVSRLSTNIEWDPVLCGSETFFGFGSHFRPSFGSGFGSRKC